MFDAAFGNTVIGLLKKKKNSDYLLTDKLSEVL